MLNDGDKYCFYEGDQHAEDEPDVNHLDVRGRRKLRDLGGEDGEEEEHQGEVHSYHSLKVFPLELGGDEGEYEEPWSVRRSTGTPPTPSPGGR